ncbi:hypothetical protein AKO1_007779 [Acrasis kona]|uniref:Uncharacterized protein n=1 Tax=Acrasis kona TaxID=1008807 RepID=A0AAW2YQS5_9EUKA
MFNTKSIANKLLRNCQARTRFYLVHWPNGTITHRLTEKDEHIQEDFLTNIAREAHAQHVAAKNVQPKDNFWEYQPMSSAELKSLSDIFHDNSSNYDFSHSYMPVMGREVHFAIPHSHNQVNKNDSTENVLSGEAARSQDMDDVSRSKDPEEDL